MLAKLENSHTLVARNSRLAFYLRSRSAQYNLDSIPAVSHKLRPMYIICDNCFNGRDNFERKNAVINVSDKQIEKSQIELTVQEKCVPALIRDILE